MVSEQDQTPPEWTSMEDRYGPYLDLPRRPWIEDTDSQTPMSIAWMDYPGQGLILAQGDGKVRAFLH